MRLNVWERDRHGECYFCDQSFQTQLLSTIMNPDKLTLTSIEFLKNYKETEANGGDLDALVTNYVERMEATSCEAPEFPTGLNWLNCSAPLRLANELQGKLRVLDFFTYCCINCMHVLPDLHGLEEKLSIADGIAVVGVHSAKFGNEKVTANILSAVLRYDITHPVVNDHDAIMWNQMSIKCWPTFAIVSPSDKILLYLVGEGHRDVLIKFCEVSLSLYKKKGLITNQPLPIQLEKETTNADLLSYPGKICLTSKPDSSLVLADTGHDRILLLSPNGIIKQKIGSSERGYQDGTSSSARFNCPQGVVAHDDCVYVADTENHCIRKIDLVKDLVSTVAGANRQGNDKEGGKIGTMQEISSPWDLAIGPAPGSSSTEDSSPVLYIAMAGTHQIWAYYLTEAGFFKGGSHPAETCVRVAGSGNEENRNNSYPHKAAFAQPSGITLAKVKDANCLYVADSESSSVRVMDVKSGGVKGCVGAERDPMNLFAFGDADGKGIDAKLQHPLAVAWNPVDGLIYAADSYNHKVKVIDPVKCTAASLAGNGQPGFKDGSFPDSQFNEPGGLCISDDGLRVFVADTNNNAIRVLDLRSKTVTKLPVIDPESVASSGSDDATDSGSASTSPRPKRLVGKNALLVQNDPVTLNCTTTIAIRLTVRIPEGCSFTEDVESRWQCDVIDALAVKSTLDPSSGVINKNGSPIEIMAHLVANDVPLGVFEFQVMIYYCSPSGSCHMSGIVIQQPFVNSKRGSNTVNIEHEVKS